MANEGKIAVKVTREKDGGAAQLWVFVDDQQVDFAYGDEKLKYYDAAEHWVHAVLFGPKDATGVVNLKCGTDEVTPPITLRIHSDAGITYADRRITLPPPAAAAGAAQ